jgi:hypothetical protein
MISNPLAALDDTNIISFVLYCQVFGAIIFKKSFGLCIKTLIIKALGNE